MLSDRSIAALCGHPFKPDDRNHILEYLALWESDVKSDMITPFTIDQLQPCTYDVTLGGNIISIEETETSKTGYIDASTKETYNFGYTVRSLDSRMVIPPDGFILGTTAEQVNIPNRIAAKFEGKSSLGRIGLATHVTAGFIDPGFSGNITLEIKNLSNAPIMLHKGMRIGQLSFDVLDRAPSRCYGSPELKSHYQHQVGVTPATGDSRWTEVSDKGPQMPL